VAGTTNPPAAGDGLTK